MKIKEVEKILQMNAQTIRYYDKLGFLTPKRDANGYRNYTEEDIKILKKIRFLRELDIPLEIIERIISNQDEFQNILENHIKNLQIQVDTLKEIQNKCISLNQKNIPLLDAVVNGEFEDISYDSKTQINSVFQKAIEFMKPYSVITIGKKITPYQFIKSVILTFISVIFIDSVFIMYLKTRGFINSISLGLWIVITLILTIMCVFILFKEKYYEFGETHFYIFDSYKMKLKSMLAIINNSSNQLAKCYLYKDIDHVKITVEKKTGGLGFGPETYFNILYDFHMIDGYDFTINSSLYNKNDQNRKSVYDILEYHKVKIIDKNNIKEALVQKELSLYEYLENKDR